MNLQINKSMSQQIIPVHIGKQYTTAVNFKARNPHNCLVTLQTDAQYQNLIKGIIKELSEHSEKYFLFHQDKKFVDNIISEIKPYMNYSLNDRYSQYAWQAINKLMGKAKDNKIIQDSIGKWIPKLIHSMSSYTPHVELFKAEQALDFADFLCSRKAKPLIEHPSIKNDIFKLFENNGHGEDIYNARVFLAKEIVAENLLSCPHLLNDPKSRLDLVISSVKGIKKNDILSYYGRDDNRIMNIYIRSGRCTGVNVYDDTYQIACKIREYYKQNLEASKRVYDEELSFVNQQNKQCKNTHQESDLSFEEGQMLTNGCSQRINNIITEADRMAKWYRSFSYDEKGKLLRAEATYP